MIGVLSVLTMLACMVAFLLGLVVLAYPLKRIGMTKRWHGAALAAGAFVLFMIAGLGLPPETTSIEQEGAPNSSGKASSAPSVVTVAKASPVIRGIAETTEFLIVDLWSQQWSDEDHLFVAGDAVQDIGGALQAGASDSGSAPTVMVTVSTPSVDRLGKKGEMILVSLFFRRADLMAADFENLSVGRTLNLAEDVRFGPEGAKVILAYCLTERGLDQSRPFCALAERSAR